MSLTDDLHDSLERIEARRGRLDLLTRAWVGESSAAFLSESSRRALDGRLARLSVGFPRLIVRSRTDRLRVTGLRRAGEQDADPGLWDLWRAAGLVETSELVHTDRDLYGAGYVTVWGHATRPGVPVVVASSPLTTGVDIDPATREVLASTRRWDSTGASWAVRATPDALRRYRAPGLAAPAGATWTLVETVPNPWGVVPTVPFVRRVSTDDHDGTSAVADVLDLTDAVAKTLQDAIVTSEYFARPRRWATGLELQYDDDGNAMDPFEDSRFLQAEAPDAKFGQLDPPRLDGYGDLIATLVQQIAAVSGLPPHYLGLHGDQPANADSIRAAETQLTSQAYAEQRAIEPGWSAVAALLWAVATGGHPDDMRAVPVWASPEVRTPAQAADAAVKLHGMGVPVASLLVDPLGYDPQQARRVADDIDQATLRRAAESLARFTP